MARLLLIIHQLENFLLPDLHSDHPIVHLVRDIDDQLELLDTRFTRQRQARLTSLQARLRVELRDYTEHPLDPTELEVAYQLVSDGLQRLAYLEATDYEAFYSSD